MTTTIEIHDLGPQLERLVTAFEGIAVAQLAMVKVAEEGLALQNRAVAINEQMVATSKELEDTLVAQMTPKTGGRN